MRDGKPMAQAGHAFLDAWFHAHLTHHADIAQAYAALRPGTKITLACTLATLERAESRLLSAGLPCVRIYDREHIHPPDFDGTPVLTALGAGPLTRVQGRKALGFLPLWPGHRKGGAS